ncbi:O-antigen ligase family protein [Patescibacteria group bacterium]|nr:O-antigen ligase family protein [Patescibacteria group bacterium]
MKNDLLSGSVLYNVIDVFLTRLPPLFAVAAAGSAVFVAHTLGQYSGTIQFLYIFFCIFVILTALYKELLTPLCITAILLSQFDVGWGRQILLSQYIAPGAPPEQYSVWFLVNYADILFFVLFCAMIFLVRKRGTFKPFQTDYLLIALLLWASISALVAVEPAGPIVGLFSLTKGIAVYFIASRIMTGTQVRLRGCIIGFIGILVFQSAWAGYQFVKGGPTGRFFDLASFKSSEMSNTVATQGTTIFRPSGTLVDPNVFALYILMLLPVPLYLFITEKNKTVRLLLLWILLVAVGAIFLSSSRTAYAITALLMLFVARTEWALIKESLQKTMKSLRVKIALLLSALFMLLYVFPNIAVPRIEDLLISGQTNTTITSRVNLSKEALALIQFHPIFGVGINNFVPEMTAFNITGVSRGFLAEVHNLYLLIAAEMGLPGLCIFLIFVYAVLRHHPKATQPISKALFLGICVYLLFGFSIPAFLRGSQFTLLMCMFGLYASISDHPNRLANRK